MLSSSSDTLLTIFKSLFLSLFILSLKSFSFSFLALLDKSKDISVSKLEQLKELIDPTELLDSSIFFSSSNKIFPIF